MKIQIITFIKKLFVRVFIIVAGYYILALIFHPEKRLMERVSTHLHEQAGILLDYSDVKLGFPHRIIIYNPSLKQIQSNHEQTSIDESKSHDKIFFSGERLSVSIAFKAFFHGKAGLNFKSKAYGGAIDGTIQTSLSRSSQRLEFRVDWSDIDLSLLLKDHPNLMISTGTCLGKAELIADFNQYFIYKGPVHISIENTRLNLPDNFKDYLEFLEFNTINGEFVMNHSEIQVQKIELLRSDTVIQIAGTVDQRIPLSDSVLDLQIKLYMLSKTQPFDKDMYIPLRLKGTIDNPDVYFLGQKL
ncbi:MAG: type II secretion system protein GspN [bacterium]